MDKINIVFAADNNYAQHAAVAMVSLLKNTVNPAMVQFYLIADELTADIKDKLVTTVNNLGSSLEFVTVKDTDLKNGYVSGNLTRAAYFRLDIPNILPAQVHKVIYLDCDVIVRKDIAELWNTELGETPLAAVADFGILASTAKLREKEEHIGWTDSYSYFNSGVLILNLDQWRANNYSKKVLQLVETKKYRHHDQDALNEVFLGSWYQLPVKWNVIPPVYNMTLRVITNSKFRKEAVEALKDIAIVHYAGGYKPWQYFSQKGFNSLYYIYLEESAFKDATMPQPGADQMKHYITRQIWRLRWACLCKKILG